MDNFIIIGIIVVIIAFCVFSTVRRIKNKTCCSGGGSRTLVERKVLTEPVIIEKSIKIEGMHCENCKNNIERRINRLDGALCKVNLRKNTALVQLTCDISDDELKSIIEELDFTVTGIETRKE